MRHLLSLISNVLKTPDFYSVDEYEESINVSNIVHHTDSHPVITDYGTDCSESDSESECDNYSDDSHSEVDYDSDGL